MRKSLDELITEAKQAQDAGSLNAAYWEDVLLAVTLSLMDEHSKLAKLDFAVAGLIRDELDAPEKSSVAYAKAKVNARKEYLEYREQYGRVKAIEEMAKVAKRRIRMAEGNF